MMNDQMRSPGGGGGGFPPHHQTTTQTTTTTTSPQWTLDWIKVDTNYFRSLPGIIKLVQFFLGILCMALASPAYLAGTHFFLFVCVMAFILTTLWIFIYLLSIRESLQLRIPWVLLEFYYCGGTAAFLLIATIVQFSVTANYGRAGWTAAAVFGLFNTVAYGAGAALLFKEWKANSAGNNPNVP